MRTIKFRGKRRVNNIWVYGCYHEVNDYTYIFWQGNETGVFSETVGQFTGLTDKNGKEIYEGDIVRWEDSTGNEMYGGSIIHPTQEVIFEGGAFNPVCLMPESEFEVIGNVHDTPELLTK